MPSCECRNSKTLDSKIHSQTWNLKLFSSPRPVDFRPRRIMSAMAQPVGVGGEMTPVKVVISSVISIKKWTTSESVTPYTWNQNYHQMTIINQSLQEEDGATPSPASGQKAESLKHRMINLFDEAIFFDGYKLIDVPQCSHKVFHNW